MRPWFGAAALALLTLPGLAGEPPRTVAHGTVVSRGDPAVTIAMPKQVHYVGTDRFLLRNRLWGDFDDCQLFAFVDAGKGGMLRKLYWVQFEAYLPNHPNLRHTYDSPRRDLIGGLKFYVDSWVEGRAAPNTGSDEAHFYDLLAARGYKRTPMMFVRLVHLTDATKRKELMIIYGEPLPPAYTAAQLRQGGRYEAKWQEIKQGLIARVERSVVISPLHHRGG